jgi:hypothetical protein
MGGEGTVRDWQAEAEELRLVVGRLRARVVALTRTLPLDTLELLEKDPADPALDARSWDIFDGWEDTIVLSKADVEEELRRLWARLAPPEEP